MAKIAYLFPTPLSQINSGFRVRGAQLRDGLIALGHNVRLHPLEGAGTHDVGSSHASSRWIRPIRFTGSAQYTALTRWLAHERPDVVIATHPNYTDLVPWSVRHRVPIIVDTHNVESSIQMSRAHRRSAMSHMSVVAAELLYMRRADRVWALSPTDTQQYARWMGRERVSYVPFVYPLPSGPQPTLEDRAACNTEVVFVGAFGYAPNVRAAVFLASHMLPQLRKTLPDVTLLLVGRDPPPEVRRLHGHGIVVTGEVDSVDEYYRRAAVVAAPIDVGGGVKTKMLEAMAHGSAIVATPAAMAGTAARGGVHYVAAPFDGRSFAGAVSRLLGDDRLRTQLGQSARALIESEHGPGRLRSALEREVTLVLGSRS